MHDVSIIEDHPATLIGLKSVIGENQELALVLSVRSVEAFEAESRGMRPHVVLLDLGLPDGLEGPEAVRHLSVRGHIVLVMSAHEEEMPVLEAIEAGAKGYLTKEASPSEIVRAVCAVAVGDTYFSATVAGYLLRDRTHLTPRQTEVLRLMASGETSADIARELHIAKSTVEGYLAKIGEVTGRRRRTDKTRLAYEMGMFAFRGKRGRPS
ncbi:response regulator [Actinomadura gamaensis]|uniref:Response regulator n=1 Tax=Actinomadura gamaensis TaxID=1763541 RepID=A0ABV9TRQ0_9ACTN